jgi:hypothetical protein
MLKRKEKAMRTVETYMVRKPCDFAEVESLCKQYARNAEVVKVIETVDLTPEVYEKVCNNPMDDYEFLARKGGYDDDEMRMVIELKCPEKPTLYVDPSGSSYCRYMGLEITE